MRKLMWFGIGFAAACALSARLLWSRALLLLCAAALLLSVSAALLTGFRKWLRIPAAVLLGVAMGFAWFSWNQAAYLFPLKPLDGTTQNLSATLTSYSTNTPYGSAVEGEITYNGKTYPILLYINTYDLLEPGDTLQGSFRMRLTTPGGEKDSFYYQGKGIFLIGNQVGELEIQPSETEELRFFPVRWAYAVKSILQSCLPGDVFPFAQGLLLGDSSGLDYEMQTAFKLSGIAHILAVSGLHVAILYGLVVRLTGNRRFLTPLLGLPVLFFFAAMAGFTPSVSRASMMLAFLLLSRMLDREYDPPTELALVVIVLLVHNPMAVTSVSLQLSVASVAGILAFRQPIFRFLRAELGDFRGKTLKTQLKFWLSDTVATTLGASGFSIPLLAYHFGAVSLISVVTNLAVLWVVSFVFYGILLVCGLGFLSPAAGAFLGTIVAWPIRYILFVAGHMGAFPYAAVYTRNALVIVWLVLCYGVLLVCFLKKKVRVRIPFAIVGLSLCALMAVSWLLPRMGDCRATVLDVGQGQSILLQSGGENILIDCGGSRDTAAADAVAETLLSQSITRLDAVILTHYDRDHANGLPYLLTRVHADCLLLPMPQKDPEKKKAAALSGQTIRYITDSVTIPAGNGELTIFPAMEENSDGENSMAILFDSRKCAILITGDRYRAGELELLKNADLPRVDLLIAGHHGSKYATSEELLKAVRPKNVVISVGADNDYGHPAAETLSQLEYYNCTVYRTDKQGTVVFRK